MLSQTMELYLLGRTIYTYREEILELTCLALDTTITSLKNMSRYINGNQKRLPRNMQLLRS